MTSSADLGTTRRITLDHTHLRGHITGIERVTLDLFAAEALAPHAVTTVRSRGLAGMIAAQHVGLAARTLTDRASLLICPGFPPGPLATLLGERCLTYVHDTFLLTRPQDLSWKSRLYLAPSFRFAMRHGRRFFVNSRTTGQALRRLCRPDALVALLRPDVRDVFGLAGLPGPAPYTPLQPLRFLAIGTIEPRKDYGASVALVTALNAAGIAAELHLVGRVGWGRHPFLDARPAFLTLHGYLDEAALRGLAARCHLFLSTSKAEGLGLPLLEAQHGGLPVVAPRGPVFSEVLGDSGLLIDPADTSATAAAILNWARSGALGRAPAAARANVARWNALAGEDAARFRDFLTAGISAYTRSPDSLVV